VIAVTGLTFAIFMATILRIAANCRDGPLLGVILASATMVAAVR
jgi:hypothetical protein